MKNKRASVLAATMIILGIIMVSALSISIASIRDRKASIGSSKANLAFQSADSGIEKVMDAIVKNRADGITVGSLGLSCDDENASGHAVLQGNGYTVELKKEVETDSTDCDTLASDIASIKSTGSDSGQSQRAIEAAVASASGFGNWVNVYNGLMAGSTNIASDQATTDGLLVASITPNDEQGCELIAYTDGNSNPSTFRTYIRSNSSAHGPSFTLPVRKNDYYRLYHANTTTNCTAYVNWLPLNF